MLTRQKIIRGPSPRRWGGCATLSGGREIASRAAKAAGASRD
jgi:hypothetical protein